MYTVNVYDANVTYTTNLGNLIKLEREKRGWEQADLAARLSVKQQTVSRWEKGNSRPQYDDVLKVADLFSGDVYEWLAKAGYDIDEPDISLTPYLPLHNLSAEKFEFFSRDLIQALNPGADVNRYGTPGHKQDGIDIYARLSGSILDYQCKRQKQFGPADIKKAVTKTTFKAKHHYLLLSRTASTPARKQILNHSQWSLWDREDISAKVRGLPKDEALRLVDTYFPGKRKSFLGEDEPSPWFTPDQFYLPLADRLKLFSHGWKFVGRQKEQELLKEFEKQVTTQAIFISGRGGIGKSRLLREWAQEAGKLGNVRFVSPGSEIEAKDIELLPTGPSYLVIDDAHERADILAILNGVARTRSEMKILLSTRPYGISRLKDELSRSGITYDSEKIITLNDLTVEDAKLLSTEILSDPSVGGDVQYAQKIAEITKDCPLATVIGSRLVGEGTIKPDLLKNEKRFREERLSRFRDVIAGEIGGSDATSIHDLLEFLAMVQPFNPSDPEFKEAAEKLFEKPFDKIIRDISALEDAGVLLRRGNRLRIIPDLLADYIRADASYDERSNKPTGYADRVFTVLKNKLATNLLVNISQLDWRLAADGAQSSVLNEVWSNLKDQFKKAKVYERASILEALGKVSYYQPEQALEFIRLALDEPSEEVEAEFEGLGLTETPYRVVIEKIPPILRYVAYNVDHLIEALDILKQLAEKDERSTNPRPDHPIRVLQDLASIEPGKPGAYNEAVTTHAIGWLHEPAVGKFSPFDVLDQLLQTEGHTSESKGFSIIMKPFTVRPEAVAGIRQRIVDAAFEVINNKPLNEGMRALKTLSASLSYPMGILGRNISNEDRASWDPGIVTVLQGLAKVVTDPKLDPLIAVEVRGAVSWLAGYGSEVSKPEAKKVLESIPTTLDHELSRAIVDSWGWTFKDDGQPGRDEETLIKWRVELIEKLLAEYKDNLPNLISKLEERITAVNEAKMTRYADAGPFLGELMKLSPDLTTVLGKYLLDNPSSPLIHWFGAVVTVMAEQDRDASLALVKDALEKEDVAFPQTVARALGWGIRLEVVPEEIQFIQKLALSSDGWVRKNIVRAMTRFPKESKSTAIDILLSINITDSKDIADEVLGEFEDRNGAYKSEDLSDKQVQQILSNLVKCPSIDDYNINLFLSKVSFTHPVLTLKLLTDRIEYKEQNEGLEDYQPLPFEWRRSESLRFHETDQYEQSLRTVRNWATVETGNWIRFHYGADLFKLISAGFDSTTLKVLEEWIMSSNERQLEAAAALLGEAKKTFVWENQQFVVDILDQAQKYGSTCYNRVCSALHTSVIQGGKSGTPGQPFPEDLAQRDRSYEIMSKLPPGSPAQRFYKMLYEEAIIEIKRDTYDELDSD